jgi:hypothetical protein
MVENWRPLNIPMSRPLSIALLLDGGGLGGGVASELKQMVKAAPHRACRSIALAHTTIPGPSSVEEEGGWRLHPQAPHPAALT